MKATSLGDPEQYLCSCGQRIRECEFWREINADVTRQGAPFDITDAGTDYRAGLGAYERRLLGPLHRGPVLEFARDAALSLQFDLASAPRRGVATHSIVGAGGLSGLRRADMIVDSSKIGLATEIFAAGSR